ncbi:adapter protein MecA 1/2 [Evansella caseinilytica]|uniref:Adapter protein MecA n=1 Tax=Evansella caseinilytica TaxID=1503961 RepID=A0A1H3NCU9_9BACI|nr:genetic competence negative regulator [Evansella caseinilytica]SDY86029.1 adapter protein MecA 1/2 [Evansella caseinilytica]
MRLERLASDKIKIFLSFDDLRERGISKDEIWMDVPKVHDLFRDMISEASSELGFDAEGPVIVEVFALPSQGMVVIVTIADEEEDAFDDSFIELQITMDATDQLLFRFHSIEDVIQLAKTLSGLNVDGGALYSYEEHYYLLFEEKDTVPLAVDTFSSIVSEYGELSTMTIFRLQEYGKSIIDKNAVFRLNKYFS